MSEPMTAEPTSSPGDQTGLPELRKQKRGFGPSVGAGWEGGLAAGGAAEQVDSVIPYQHESRGSAIS
jgi:hypothetical protein